MWLTHWTKKITAKAPVPRPEKPDAKATSIGGRPEWDEWIAKGRSETVFEIRKMGFTVADVEAQKAWPTLGRYISSKPGGVSTPHQEFLKTLVYGRWREYSAIAHGTSDGLLRTGVFFIADSFIHEDRPNDDNHLRLLSTHLAQAAGILLCIITELQAHFRFDGADINSRIHET